MAKFRYMLIASLLFLAGPSPSTAQDNSGRPPITPENAEQVTLLSTAGSELIRDMVWSPDGNTLAISTTSQMQLLNATDLNAPALPLCNTTWEEAPGFGSSSSASELAYTPDGRALLAVHDRWLDIWNTGTWTLQGVYRLGDPSLVHFAYDAEHDRLVYGTSNINVMAVIADGITETTPPAGLYIHAEQMAFLQWGLFVSDLAFSPNGRYVALASADTAQDYPDYYSYSYPVTSDVLIWNVEHTQFGQDEPTPDLTLSGHTRPVQEVAFSPDGSLLASASLDGTVRLWSMPDGILSAVLQGHLAAVWDVDFSPDGSRLVTASQDGTLRLWTVSTGEQLQVIRGFGSSLATALFSPDGTRIAAAGQDGSIWILDATTGDVLDSRPGQKPLWSVAFSPDGQTLATGNDQNEVVLWDVHPAEATATMRQVLSGHQGSVYDLVFSPDGTLLASASADHTVRLWDARAGAEVAVLEGHTGAVYGIAFNEDGRLLASGSYDHTVRLWDMSTRETLQVLPSADPVFSVAFRGDILAYGDIQLWDITHNRPIRDWEFSQRSLESYEPPLSKIVISGDGQTLIHSSSVYINTDVNLYDLNIRSISASPVIAIYGNMIAADSLTLIDLETEQSFQPSAKPGIHTSTGIPRDITFSPDGSLIVTVGSSGMLNFWGIEPRASE